MARTVPSELGSSQRKLARVQVLVLSCFLAASAVFHSGCDLPNMPPGRGQGGGRGGEGPGRRNQAIALTPQQELEMGRAAYKEVLSNPKEFGRVVPADNPTCQRVRNVAGRIIHAAGIEPLQREINLRKGYRYEWEINVFDKPTVNAFCLPGGKIAVFEGILRLVKNDDQLATVISHEISHALAHHSSERLAEEKTARGILSVFSKKKHSREQESEADHIGVFLMTFAGYDPAEAVQFWERMAQYGAKQQRPPEFLSDHPNDEHRIQAIKKWVGPARAAKQAFDSGRIARPR